MEIVMQNINLSINFIEIEDEEVRFDWLDVKFNERLKELIDDFKKSPDSGDKISIYDEIIQMVRGQLKSMDTVGQILDIMKFSVKMLLVENSVGDIGIILLNEIFQLLPKNWEEDPVKVHLITKTVYETSNQDFNNTFFILTKIINFNRLGFYIALTLFWSLYLHFFKKDTHHYYKMYDVNKFFKLLQLHEKDADDTKMELGTIFQLLLLISIYQSYVLRNNDNLSDKHNVFHDVFKVSPHDLEKLKTYLSKMKTLIEIRYPVNSNQNTDALMLVEFLESDLISNNTNLDGNQQSTIERKTMENSFDDAIVVDDESSVGGDDEVHDE
jgi:hypothetical protein